MPWYLIISLGFITIYLVIMLIYYLIQERLLFVASPLQKKFQFTLATPFDEIFIESEQGVILHGLHIKAPESDGLILYLHGNTGNMKRWSLVAEELTTYDKDVLVMDYRGFGKSEGRRTMETLYADAQTVYDKALEMYPADKITIYGRSMGTGLAVKLASDNMPSRLVLETPYLHMADVAFYHFPFLPIKWLLRFPFRSDKHIADVKCPVIFFHGTRDRVVPYKSGLKLYELVSEDVPHEMVTIPRGKHSNLSSYALFREKMNEFLRK